MEIEQFQHPDSIWTWKSNTRGSRASLWIPYLHEITKAKGARWNLVYNGGELEIDLKKVDTIMLYGASGTVPVAFLDQLGIYRIPMLVHRRNMDAPAVFMPAPRPDAADLMGRQILVRTNAIKSAYVARTLVRARFQALGASVAIAEPAWKRFNQIRDVDQIRAFEAQWSKRYWTQYFTELGFPHERRRRKNPVSDALNACSFFLYGVILRWILVHRLSPQHGFLHRPTDYPALVYDLIEPYRYIAEMSVRQAASDVDGEYAALTAAALSNIKRRMDETVYVPATRQYVRRKNLVHGAVLALRAWLLLEMPRFVLPGEGEKQGGRPPEVSYVLPGNRLSKIGGKISVVPS